MGWCLLARAAVLALAVPACAAMAGQAEGTRGQMRAVIVEAGPTIDGTLDSPLWAKCPPMPLGECTADRPGKLKTTARVLLDATRLYVAWQCDETDTGSLASAATQHDGDVWQDDCVELFVSGDMRQGCFHFVINPRGVLYDARAAAPPKYDKSCDTSAAVKSAVRENVGWTVTLSVPLKEIGACVGDDQTWTLNLNRTRPARGGAAAMEWSWAILGSNDYHQVRDYGQITGVKVPRREDGVTRTAEPPPAPPRSDRPVQAGSVLVYRRLGDLEVREGSEGLARTIDLKISGSGGLKLAFLARGEGGVDRAALNLYDARSRDNTTPKDYRILPPGRWLPVLYRCDQFRYNSRAESTVAKEADYTNLRFHGRTKEGKGVLHLRDAVIYRGEDSTPPPAPGGLKASAGDEGVALTWDRAEDNVGIALYVVSRAGADGKFAKVAESPLPACVDRPPAAGSWRYRVAAVDFQDNLSPWSAVAAAEAAKGFDAAPADDLAKDRAGYARRIAAIHAAGRGKVVPGRVMCFGDSLTGATLFGRDTEAALGRYEVVARGYAGKRTDFGRQRIEEDLAEVRPEFCLILLGTNNSKSPSAIAPAMEDLKAMAASCESRGAVPVIGTIPPRGFKDPASQPEAAYNASLIAMCRASAIPIAYMFEEFQAAGPRQELIAGDGVHLHREGFPTVGRAWRKALDQVNSVLLDRPD